MSFKPTLAVNADFSKIQYPVYASPKLDGIRCSIVDGKALSRTLKAIPNRHIANLLSTEHYDGLDGELIVGSPTSTTCYNETVSNVMAFDKVPDFSYYVFDLHNTEWNYSQRLTALKNKVPQCYDAANIVVLEQNLLINEDEMLAYEAAKVEEGYEGIILRSPEAPYKFGRSTVKEGYLLKVKRFVDQDAEIIGIVEEMYNGNEAQTNELGRTKRSTAASGLSGKGTMGALHVRDLESGVDFHIGTGFTAAQRQEAWDRRPELLGGFVKYKYFPVGVKDKPRHPVFLGFRDARDM